MHFFGSVLSRVALVALSLFFCRGALAAPGLVDDDYKAVTPEDLYGERKEIGVVPIIGGDSDIGLAVGAIGSVASFALGAKPYLWRAEVNALISFKHPDTGWVVPFQDYYIKTTFPALFHNQLRLVLRAAYTQYATLHYWGLGNASQVLPNSDPLFYQYKLRYPHATAELHLSLPARFSIKFVADYVYNQTTIYQDSKIEQDLQSMPDKVKGAGHTAIWLFSAGVAWDTRDSELAPHTGQFHSLVFRGSPGGMHSAPYRFGAANLAFRGYIPVWNPYLILALRLAGDALMGDVPFYNLPESNDGYTIGGMTGVRGIPAQRYSGKGKVYGNAELRIQLARRRLGNQEVLWGLVAFADAGRVWADLHANPQLDGNGLGLKYGFGGGIRLQFGSTFVLRGDAAWSPDADPIGLYFNVGQIF